MLHDYDYSNRLLKATEGCRRDMHEPDEQGVSAKMSGFHLDNAMGDSPYDNCGEFTIGIERDGHTEWFNLATLIALARVEAKRNADGKLTKKR